MKVAIIQARMDSHRLPGKVLKRINGKPAIERLINRLKLAKKIDKIVLAVPATSQDDILFNLAERLNVVCVRGSSENVLSRLLKAAREVKADIIVRITGDCPLIDPGIIDRMLNEFEKEKYDYFSNDVNQGGHSRGFDVEIFSCNVLKKASELAKDDFSREHVTFSIYQHPEIFKIMHYKAPEGLYRPDYRICVDEKSDLVLVRRIFDYFKPREDFSAQEIIEYLDKNPKIASINKNVKQKT